MSAVTQISRNSYFLEGHDALVVFSGEPTTNIGEIKKVQNKSLKDGFEIKFWGGNNLLPQDRELLVSDNNIVGSLIQTKRDITLGVEVMAYQERFERDKDGKSKRIIDEIEMPDYAQEFFKKIDIDNFMLNQCADLLFHANIFQEDICLAGGKIESIKHLPAKFVRAEKQDSNGKINNYYFSGFWHKITNKDAIVTKIPCFDAEAGFQAKYVSHFGDSLLNDTYYNQPMWWGSRTWIELANAIAVFHKNNLKNGYTIRYLIEVDDNYFKDTTFNAQTAEQIAESGRREDEARRAFTENMNEMLAGGENAGRAIFTEMSTQRATGHQMSNVKITPIDADLKDEAMIRLFDASNTATISAQAIHPTLAAIETAGKLSSGTEIRNAFLMYLAIKTPLPRKILWKFVDRLVLKNGWDPKIKFGFRDVELTALSEDKSGAKQTDVVK